MSLDISKIKAGDRVLWQGREWRVCGVSKGFALIETDAVDEPFKILISDLTLVEP